LILINNYYKSRGPVLQEISSQSYETATEVRSRCL